MSPSQWELAYCKEAEICERVTAWARQGACREESVLVLFRQNLGGEGSPRRGKLPQGQPGSPCEVRCTSSWPQPPPQPWYLWGSGCKTTSHLKLRLLPNSSSLWQRGSTWVRVLPPLTCLQPPASTCPDLSAVCQVTKWGLCSRSRAFGAGLGTQELSECCPFSSSFLNCSWSLQRALHQKHLHL